MAKVKYLAGVILIVVCANFRDQESDEPREKPKVNFSGTLKDTSNNSMNVENVLIGGLYKEIPVYAIPQQADINPETNTTLLDLTELSEIRPAHGSDPRQGIALFHNRSYIAIEVVYKDASVNQYVVETSRKISCDEIKASGPNEKRLSFEALASLKLEKQAQRIPTATEKADEKRNIQQEQHCDKARATLQQLEIETEKINGPQRTVIGDLVDQAKNWLGGICGAR